MTNIHIEPEARLDPAMALAFLENVQLGEDLCDDPQRVEDWYMAVGDAFHALVCLIGLRVQADTGRTVTLPDMMRQIRAAPQGHAVQDFFETLDAAPRAALLAIPAHVKRGLVDNILNELRENYVVVAVLLMGDRRLIPIGERLAALSKPAGKGRAV
jgi:hypothetical protein